MANTLDLFGGERPWSGDDWTASDDRVRGGSSQSHLGVKGAIARFHGNLDIDTLGGAGFASQRTTAETRTWDLSKYDGIQLVTTKADGKRYTVILKDALLAPNSSNGREQATTSYEYDFVAEDAEIAATVQIPWASFKPTYRGREQKDAKPLDTSQIKRFSIMMRSFFASQQGPFSLSLQSISACRIEDSRGCGNFECKKDLESGGGSRDKYRRGWRMLPTFLAGMLTVAAAYVVYRRWTR